MIDILIVYLITVAASWLLTRLYLKRLEPYPEVTDYGEHVFMVFIPFWNIVHPVICIIVELQDRYSKKRKRNYKKFFRL